MSVRPFICTCDRRRGVLRRFVESFNKVKHSMRRPIVYYDGTDPEYISLLESMDPLEMVPQREDWGIQKKMCYELPRLGYEMAAKRGEKVLFLEDDVIFSSKFRDAIWLADKRMDRWKEVDILTMYGSGNCYWPDAKNPNYMYQFNGNDFYGNLALVFSPKLMKWWASHSDDIWNLPVGGWDIKIGQGFQKFGFNWYCTRVHYVQHQIGLSAISGKHKEQQSALFAP